MTPVEALAEVWAAIDGDEETFCRERDGKISIDHPDHKGLFEGYMADAQDMIALLEARGFTIVPAPRTVQLRPKADRGSSVH